VRRPGALAASATGCIQHGGVVPHIMVVRLIGSSPDSTGDVGQDDAIALFHDAQSPQASGALPIAFGAPKFIGGHAVVSGKNRNRAEWCQGGTGTRVSLMTRNHTPQSVICSGRSEAVAIASCFRGGNGCYHAWLPPHVRFCAVPTSERTIARRDTVRTRGVVAVSPSTWRGVKQFPFGGGAQPSGPGPLQALPALPCQQVANECCASAVGEAGGFSRRAGARRPSLPSLRHKPHRGRVGALCGRVTAGGAWLPWMSEVQVASSASSLGTPS
jgi:hypothetical protein